MSWFPEHRKRTWLESCCARVVKAGPIPKHIAIIMDGNRRFAVKKSMDCADGHLKGFDKLANTLDWCYDLGITEVTVYAFSIENFKRSKEEVECLMELSRQKFAKLMEERELLNKHGVCIRVLGNLTLLPADIQALIAEAVTYTKDNTKARLNVCFAYTSRDEISSAVRELAEGVKLGLITSSDISERLMSQCLYTADSPEPDMLIRTSGEVRLSDFLLWQSSFSVLTFIQVLWPEFSIWHLFAAVLHYQRHREQVQNARDNNEVEGERLLRESDYRCVLAEIQTEKGDNSSLNSASFQARLVVYAQEREQRIRTFLDHVQSKRNNFFNEITFKPNNLLSVPPS